MTEHTTGPVTSTAGTLGGDGPLRIAPGPGGEPAFDEHRPPSAELVADCVHCGFCLPTCPTYVAVGRGDGLPARADLPDERGPAGRADDRRRWSQHFDACLGCMACVTACPSGVQYDTLIEATRAQVERRFDRPAADRALRACDLRALPLPAPAAPDARAAAALPGHRAVPAAAHERCAATDLADARRDGGARAAVGTVAAGAPAHAGAGPAPGHRRRCCSAACSASSSPASTPPPRGCWRPRASTSSPRRRRAAAGPCRRTTGARPRPRRFARALIDEFDRRRRRLRRGQLRRLRVVDEGVRRPAGRRPGVRRAGAGLRGKGPRRGRAPRRARPGRAAAPAAGHGRLPRRLPPRPRPGHPQPAPRAAARHPRARAARDRRPRALLRVGGHLQPAPPRAGARARGPQGRHRAAHRRRSCWSPPTRAA